MAVPTFSIRIKPELKKEVCQVAKEKGITFTDVMHEALELWLNQLK